MKGSPDKYRVQLDFTPEAFRELEKLKTDVEASSRADTVRYAMRVLRWLINELQSGAKILVSRDGVQSGIEFPFLSHASRVPTENTDNSEWATSTASEVQSGEQAGDWVDRGREVLKQQKEQFRSAYEAGRRAYKDEGKQHS